MNWKLILIIIVAFVIFVSLGRNPFQVPDRTQDKDWFAKSLQERSKQPGGVSGFGAGSGGSGNILPTAPTAPQPTMDFKTNQPDWATMRAQIPAPPAAVTSQIPGQENAPAFYLRSGQRIYFAGAEVFTLAANGTLTKLPDGEYTMQSGDVIVIEGGQRVAK